MSARQFALGLCYGLWVGMFARDLLEHLDTLAHNAKPKVRR